MTILRERQAGLVQFPAQTGLVLFQEFPSYPAQERKDQLGYRRRHQERGLHPQGNKLDRSRILPPEHPDFVNVGADPEQQGRHGDPDVDLDGKIADSGPRALVEAERALDLADFLEYLGHFARSQDGCEVVAKDDEGLED